MAKQRGPVASTFSGRVGNVVGAKLKGGEYVTRSYQPSVKNPNTRRQQAARFRLKTCSGIAAALASALKMGYAMASASSRLYPRNLFLQSILPVSGSPIVTQDGTVEITFSQVPVSAQAGVTVKPIGEVVPAAGGNPAKISISNFDAVEIGAGERVGVVVVFADNELKQAVAVPSVSNEVNVPTSMVDEYGTLQVWAFFKKVPASKTEVPADSLPWRYPSATSGSAYIGTVSA